MSQQAPRRSDSCSCCNGNVFVNRQAVSRAYFWHALLKMQKNGLKTTCRFCTIMRRESRGGGIILGALRGQIVRAWEWSIVEQRLPAPTAPPVNIFNEHLARPEGWVSWWVELKR